MAFTQIHSTIPWRTLETNGQPHGDRPSLLYQAAPAAGIGIPSNSISSGNPNPLGGTATRNRVRTPRKGAYGPPRPTQRPPFPTTQEIRPSITRTIPEAATPNRTPDQGSHQGSATGSPGRERDTTRAGADTAGRDGHVGRSRTAWRPTRAGPRAGAGGQGYHHGGLGHGGQDNRQDRRLLAVVGTDLGRDTTRTGTRTTATSDAAGQRGAARLSRQSWICQALCGSQ